MNINTSPDVINRASAQVTPGYMSGFGNSFETEALPGALPIGRNSPQRCAYGLYAEQLSGSPFTAPRGSNERSWLYRIRPSVKHSGRFAKVDAGLWRTAPCHEDDLPIAQLRWDPAPIPKDDMTFLQGVQTMTTAGDANTQAGMAAHVFLITKSMVDQHFYNADGEMMFVPQQGNLRFVTEFGRIDVEPGEIAVIPRGVKFRVEIPSGPARGYLCENYGGAFTLPERGPIGANCLANARDFLTPVAAMRTRTRRPNSYVKWGGSLFKTSCRIRRSTWWPGTAITRRTNTICGTFSPVGAIGVRSSRSLDLHGADLAVGDRGHREYRFRDLPGALGGGGKHLPPAVVSHEHHVGVHGADLRRLRRQAARLYARRHRPCTIMMLPHGPDRDAFDHASNSELKPVKLTGTHGLHVRDALSAARHAIMRRTSSTLQDDYADCWKGLEKRFDPNKP